MPFCRMIYSDSKAGAEKENVEYGTILKCSKLDIQGKPDFVFESKVFKHIVPVEIKSGTIKDEAFPHEGDMMQLAAYFAIAEEEYGTRPKYGRLIYSDYMFDIKNTAKLRRQLEETVSQMRLMLDGQKFEIEADYVKCRYCVCRKTVCEFCEK